MGIGTLRTRERASIFSGVGFFVKTPVGLIDIYPTLAELCGVEAPENLQGQSLVPMLKNPEVIGRGWALTQVRRGGGDRRFFGYSLRTPRWRYTEWDQGRQGRELYDHERDPQELANLAKDPDYASTVAELSEKLAAAVKSSFPPDGQTPEIEIGFGLPIW